ncbi:AraC family transcriptional regulator [Burkholderia multivorans]|uniref:AraC family transcriptional regulator n=2 Tax=Burkholderia multivorans TaxID=87883 RepID=UPI00123AAAA1|nr:AraC family transcriptional regulator [Burkholderia multivorans]QET31305.1 AraC family transcriptional regulator [Burkholderia multivorans]QET41276.1 AraC family transcriptional regulator [Burkholderia multivorans]
MKRLDTLIDLISRHAPVDGIHESPIRGVKLLRASSPTMPMPVIYAPTLCLVAQGTKQAALGTTTYRYDPAHFLVASVELPVMASVIAASASRPYLCLQLDLDPSELSDIAIRYPASTKDAVISPTGLILNRVTPQLLDAAIRLLALLDSPYDIDALAPLTIREMLYRLLTGPGSSVIRHMTQANGRLNQIARAIVWIREHFRGPCRIENAADVAGMSRSTFHVHFKAVTTMSPIEFRTHLRMQEAQRLMVSNALNAATASFQVGYGSPSQFSRDYARIFGMSPAQHAIQLRRRMPA